LEKNNTFIQIVDEINRRVGVAISWLIIGATLLMLYEVVTRRFLGKPTVWAGEIVTMVYGAYFILLMGYTLLRNAHVRVDVFSSRWRPKAQAVSDILGYFLFFFLFAIVCFIGGIKFAWESWISKEGTGSILNAPLWPVKATIAVGFALLLLQGISQLVKRFTYLSEEKKRGS
jgi:TRAP-type mannitol/chloroaromatic compound transport system permease small subunit